MRKCHFVRTNICFFSSWALHLLRDRNRQVADDFLSLPLMSILVNFFLHLRRLIFQSVNISIWTDVGHANLSPTHCTRCRCQSVLLPEWVTTCNALASVLRRNREIGICVSDAIVYRSHNASLVPLYKLHKFHNAINASTFHVYFLQFNMCVGWSLMANFLFAHKNHVLPLWTSIGTFFFFFFRCRSFIADRGHLPTERPLRS